MPRDSSESAAHLDEESHAQPLDAEVHDLMIGPYRVSERLGTGGMGEVLLAYDPRLDRQVAIKRVRPRVALDDEQRRRLRREARMAAKLGHGAIAQIHDLLVVGDIEHIVMEYVPGTTVRDLLELGPPPLPEALRIARRVAEGLAHAHRHGVVHRDLKTENVLLHPEGEVKIVDFGLARPEVDDDGLTSLTRPGSIVGTCRTMAPEQALGQQIDARTDLFSFGVLLYELFTGTSPFLARTQVATLQRIVQQRHRSVLELVPELPVELSELIDELLEKEPAARPSGGAEEAVRRLGEISETLRRASLDDTDPSLLVASSHPTPEALPRVDPPPTPWPWIVATALLALLLVALVAWWLGRDKPSRESVVPGGPLLVAIREPAVENDAAGFSVTEAGVLRQALRHGVQRALINLDDLAPIGEPGSDPPADADEVIWPSFACDQQICWCDLRRMRRGRLVETGRFSFPSDDPLRASRAAAVATKALYPDRQQRAETEVRVDPEDFRRFLEILHRVDVSPRGEYPDLVADAAAIRESSPEFVDIYLLEAELRSRLFQLTREQSHRVAAMELLGQARDLAGDDPDVLLKEILLLLGLGRVEEAEALLAQVEQLAPGDSRLIDRRAHILAQSGRTREALALHRRLIDLRPTPQAFFNHARLALNLGRIEEARASIDHVFELRPDSLQARTLLAELELRSGDLQVALELYRELATQDEVAAAGLALAQMLAGELDAAVAGLEALTVRFPRHPELWLNLADARSLSGRDDAEAAYRSALSAAESQNGGPSWRLDATRAQAYAHLDLNAEAAASLESMWRQAPELADAYYAAALVSALIGEREAATRYALQARATGLADHWFELPWFEDLPPRITAEDLAAGR